MTQESLYEVLSSGDGLLGFHAHAPQQLRFKTSSVPQFAVCAMADEDSQVPCDTNDGADELPLGWAIKDPACRRVLGLSDKAEGEVKDGAVVSPSKKWKRGVISPKKDAGQPSKI